MPPDARFCPACSAPVAAMPAKRRLVTAFFCDVASFHGDGAVGLFGLPVAHEDDAARAARAGLELLASLADAPMAASHGITLEARVGIEAGEVLGDVGMAASGALPGDVLNTAARLQAEAERGTVVAGPGAIRLLRDRAELRPLPPLTLKGKAEPVEAAMVVSVEDGPRRQSLVAGG